MADTMSIAEGIGESVDQDVHFTPAELARKWHFSGNTIRRLFQDEPDVIRLNAAPERRCRSPRRRHLTQLRIPARTAARVHARLSRVNEQ